MTLSESSRLIQEPHAQSQYLCEERRQNKGHLVGQITFACKDERKRCKIW